MDAEVGGSSDSETAEWARQVVFAAQRGGKGTGGGGRKGPSGADGSLFTDKELATLEETYADGITASRSPVAVWCGGSC